MTPIQLWTKHRPLARKIASRFDLPGSDRDDVVQEAMIALWEAARNFDPSKGPFPAFAGFVIERHLTDCLRVSTSERRKVLNDSARTVGDDEILSKLPHLHQVCDRAESREELVALLEAIRNLLTPFQQHCILGVASGLSYLQIGNPKRVDNESYKARRILRAALCR